MPLITGAFIEGWYVEPEVRRRGIRRALVESAEEYARAEGHREIASDTEFENVGGIDAHVALGYHEVERAVYFRKFL